MPTPQQMDQLGTPTTPLTGDELIVGVQGGEPVNFTAQDVADLAPNDSGKGVVVPFNVSVPFDNVNSHMEYDLADGNVTFTPNTLTAQVGNGCTIEILGGGGNSATFTGFRMSDTSEIDETTGALNVAFCFRTQNFYVVSISQFGVIDTTPPTVVSATAINSHTIRLVMSESVSGSVAGYSFKQNGVSITPDSVSGTTNRDFVFSETFVTGDTLLGSYNSGTGDTVDGSGNSLGSFTDQSVTNSVPPADIFLTIGTPVGTITESPAHSFNVSGPGSYARVVETMVGNGYIQAEIGTSANETWVLGLDENSSNNDWSASSIPQWKWFVFPFSGKYYVRDIAGAQTDTGVTFAAGDLVRIKATGTAIICEKSSNSGSTWTTLYSYPSARTSSSTTLYGKISSAVNAVTIKNLKGGGFA